MQPWTSEGSKVVFLVVFFHKMRFHHYFPPGKIHHWPPFVKILPTPMRANLINQHLGDLIGTVLTTYCPGFWRLANQTKT